MRRPEGVLSLLSLQSIPTTRKPTARRADAKRAHPQKTSIAIGVLMEVAVVVVVVVVTEDEDGGSKVDDEHFVFGDDGGTKLKAFITLTESGGSVTGSKSVSSDSPSETSMMAPESTTMDPALANFGPGLIKLQSLTEEVEGIEGESDDFAKDEDGANETNGLEFEGKGLQGLPW